MSGMTQDEVGEAIYCCRQSYHKKEIGKVAFTLEEVKLISKTFNLNYRQINDIFFDSELPID